ncbi:uncharacterized protein LOC113750412 [Coffea eugenioides]|uniref:uncharacterized protein LOC113750412 n=1 Tax=Coffea eugenioides TaxID=49369 RepID=UPI000F60AC6A|nr:uncharacterized protein LOC113750412 [Coffea eugenioides]
MASDDSTSRITSGASISSFTWSRTPMSSLKLAVERFDGTGHFDMWQDEVIDSLFQQGLDIAIEEKKSDDIEEKKWSTINWTLEEKFLKKSGQNKVLMKKRLFRFDYQSGTIMNEHITMFNQLVADLLNLDVKFEDEDLALMLLLSLLDEFEHLESTLLHGKENVSLDAVCSVLYSHE